MFRIAWSNKGDDHDLVRHYAQGLSGNRHFPGARHRLLGWREELQRVQPRRGDLDLAGRDRHRHLGSQDFPER
ncbi:hypothetical protein D3C87_1874520 [compost metagenome]